MTTAYPITEHKYDMIVVGAGGAGLRATFGLAQKGLKTACITKVFPTRSHTVAAQGGISAALGNMGEDDWRFHFYDTIKGSDWLGDQDAIQYMCREAIPAIIELEHQGVPFSRTAEGKIYQRPFGGMTTHYGKGTAQRTCAAADRTGHAILHTLYQQSLAHDAEFFIEYFALDLIMDEDGACKGVLALDMAEGTLHLFRAHGTVLATGGYGRAYFSATSAHTCTGDGNGMALRAGLGLQDMEFVQFHPTGIYGAGCLITEGVRGEGGILRNASGERFMERYAPTIKDLAPRDIVARSMVLEVREGRGAGPDKDYVYIDVTHLGEDVLEEKLPDITEFSRTYLGVDPVTELVPVFPTCHYVMGGIPTNVKGEVLRNNDDVVPGLYAAGECACVSVHGSNRLGTNSLLDINVFGRRAGIAAAEYAANHDFVELPAEPEQMVGEWMERMLAPHGTENAADIRSEMQAMMDDKASVFRNEQSLTEALAELHELKKRYAEVTVSDKGKRFNTELLEAVELGFLLELAEVTVACALNRKESRGGHSREDFPDRDDATYMKHTMAFKEDGLDLLSDIRLDWKPVVQTRYEPMERKY